MASMKDSPLIEKLNSSNYATWSFKLEMLLTKEELIEVVLNTPPTDLNDAYKKKDRKARALINLYIEDSQIINVKGQTTARETWLKLKTIHERSNLSSKLFLLRKLYSTRLQEGGNMNKHITYILELIDKLNAIGEVINDSHIAALYLCSLPASYDNLITALEARPETELTSEFIRSKLIDEYNRRSENSEANSDKAAKAFKTQRKFNNYNNHNSYKKNNKYCSRCNLKSHNFSECWYKNKNPNNPMRYGNNKGVNNNKNNPSSSLCIEKSKDISKTRSQELDSASRKLKDLIFLSENANRNNWVIDSGSTVHITNDKHLMSEMTSNENSQVTIANGKTLSSYGTGKVKFKTINAEGEIHQITLQDVLFVPELETNLLSVKKATEYGCTLTFNANKCYLEYNGEIYLEGEIKNNLYEVKLLNNEYANVTYDCCNKNCVMVWHKRLGHRNFQNIKEIIKYKLATGIDINFCKHDTTCESCIKSKLTDMPYPKKAKNRASKVLQLIHSDICGPIQTPSLGGKKYFLTMIDDFSRFTIIYLLSHKYEVLDKVKEYTAMVYNKFGRKPEKFRSDNAKEYTSHEMEKFLKENGIQHEFAIPYCHPQNAVAERHHRSLVEMAKSMLSEASLSNSFWGEAINTANYLLNRLPTKSNERTPYELWHDKIPDLSGLKIFGCKAFAYIDASKRRKLDDKTVQGIFVGYDYRSKGYRIYTGGRNIMIARTVKFIENSNLNTSDQNDTQLSANEHLEEKSQLQTVSVDLETDENSENLTENTGDSNIQNRRSQRSNRGVPPDRLIYLTNYNPISEPQNWSEINEIKNPVEKRSWLNAAEDEIKSLNDHNTWTLVEPPQGKKIIGSRWLFKAKYDDTGKVQKFKARLVAKGYLQKFGVDYEETFAPVASYTTIRTFLNVAAYKDLDINQVDIKTAYLHGDLEEELYMEQPEGFIKPGSENKVCKLNRAIYGLKQAARAWHSKIGSSLKNMNFSQSEADPCLYVRKDSTGNAYLIIYVDDILIAGNEKQIKEIIHKLNIEYELKNLGKISYYLGIKINKTSKGKIELDQKQKIEELVRKLNLETSKPTYIPMEPGYLKLEDKSEPFQNNTKYRQTIGSLLYIASVTRPDILAAVNILSRKNEKPEQKDWEATKRVVRYLKSTINLKLIINTDQPPILSVFADADWAGEISSRKSTSGIVLMLGNNPINWITKRQSCVALSSAEAEYVSASTAVQEVLWTIKLLEDFCVPQILPINLYEDNISCIKMISSDQYSPKTKHIDIKYKCIKNLKESGKINPEYCPTEKMTADIFTKPLPRPTFEKHRKNLQLS